MTNIITLLRTPKLFDIAIFDVVGTFFAAFLISISTYSVFLIFALLLVLGVLVHKELGIKTKLNYYLGLSEDPRPSGTTS